ncbi:33683_t:CDS:2, partial [Racocetra persica]
ATKGTKAAKNTKTTKGTKGDKFTKGDKTKLEGKKFRKNNLGKLAVARMHMDEEKNTHLELSKREKNFKLGLTNIDIMAEITFLIANFIEELRASENAKKKKDIAEEFVTKQELATLVKEAEKEAKKVENKSLPTGAILEALENLKNDSLNENRDMENMGHAKIINSITHFMPDIRSVIPL